MKKHAKKSSHLQVVTRPRFERGTPSFGGWCSIQLSYRATGRRSAALAFVPGSVLRRIGHGLRARPLDRDRRDFQPANDRARDTGG